MDAITKQQECTHKDVLYGSDPFTGPSFTLRNRVRRLLWNIAYSLAFKPSPKIFHFWRVSLLRLFGAKIGRGCHIHRTVRIWAPWNLDIGNFVGIADNVILYSMDTITIGDYAVISEEAYLCCGTHDYSSSNFQLVTKPIQIGARSWICARAFLHPGVKVPEGAVVGACSVVVKPLAKPWTVYAGNPAKEVGQRRCSWASGKSSCEERSPSPAYRHGGSFEKAAETSKNTSQGEPANG